MAQKVSVLLIFISFKCPVFSTVILGLAMSPTGELREFLELLFYRENAIYCYRATSSWRLQNGGFVILSSSTSCYHMFSSLWLCYFSWRFHIAFGDVCSSGHPENISLYVDAVVLGFDKIPLWGTFIISFGCGAISAVVIRMFVVPWQRRRIKGQLCTLCPMKTCSCVAEH